MYYTFLVTKYLLFVTLAGRRNQFKKSKFFQMVYGRNTKAYILLSVPKANRAVKLTSKRDGQ
jgi:hypothetical protein